MKQLTLFFVSLLFSTISVAQSDKARIAIFDIDLTEFDDNKIKFSDLFMVDLLKPNAFNSIPEYLIKSFTRNEDFVVIDKVGYDLIKDERERQKSEDFMEGYTVEQGKSEGIDYVLFPKYNRLGNEISVHVFSIESGNRHCEASVELIKSKASVEYTEYYIGVLMEQLNNDCFGIRYEVIRATQQKGDKVKEILIAGGSDALFQEDQDLEIFYNEEIKIKEKTKYRPVPIGECEIIEIEGPDFSRCKVTKGNEEVLMKLSNQDLFVRLKKMKK